MSKNIISQIHEETILVFDKDGVIFHSEDFKFEYFLGLFDQFEEHHDEIKSYLVESGGTPRKLRFKHICEKILNMTDAEEFVDSLVKKSNEEMDSEVLKTDFVGGVKIFIEKYTVNKKFVCSGSPQEEVDQHLKRNNITHHFISAYGGVPKKSIVINEIKQNYGSDIVFFGDTMVDYNAAEEADVTFVGLRSSKYHDPFKELDICKVHSFEELL